MGLLEAQLRTITTLEYSENKIKELIEMATRNYFSVDPLGASDFKKFLEGFSQVCIKYGDLKCYHEIHLKDGQSNTKKEG